MPFESVEKDGNVEFNIDEKIELVVKDHSCSNE